jgi:uncharacterized protein YcfJ
MKTKMIMMCAVVTLASITNFAQAGCVKGALVGGAVGHVAGKHTVLGAVGGCLVSRHLDKKKEKKAQQKTQQQNSNNQSKK